MDEERVPAILGEPEDIPECYAREMAEVGAMVSEDNEKIGRVINLAGQPAIITGEISRSEFLERVERAGLSATEFNALPHFLRFFSISTD